MDKGNGQEAKTTTLVLGGTGKTGRRVAHRLAARGLPVRVGSRFGEPPFDWEDEATWMPALRDVGSVYISYFPDIAVPGAVEAVRSFAELAVGSGIWRLVLLSGRGEEEAQRAERVVQEVSEKAGAEWTIVRCSWFSQNFSENYLLEPILDGEVVLPAGDIPEPFADTDDIADVAVAALTEEGHTGQIYELTGPRLLTFAEAVAEISQASGRKIHFVPIAVEQYASVLAEQDVPAEYVWLLTYLFSEVLDGRNAYLTDGVRRALGREPRDFADYARDTAATGVWGGER
ncbi:MAG: NmrA family transcriptional regulator [Rubrobacteraceae bacterium]